MSRYGKSGRKIRYAVVGLGHLAQVAVLPTAYESACTGRVVELPELLPKKRPTSQQEIHRAPHSKPKTVNVQSASGE
jgi:hypothetical protein